MRRSHDAYELDDDASRVEVARVHGWLATTYWSPGVLRGVVERGLRGSALVIGAYYDGQQVGITRVVSDKATFAWVCDVFVDEKHRGKGIGRAMLRFAMEHPEFNGSGNFQ